MFTRLCRAARRLTLISALGMVFALAPAMGALRGAEVAWQTNVGDAARLSARQNKAMLIMVGAEWCGPCHRMLQETMSNPALVARLNDQFVPVLIDADAQALLVEKLRIDAMPTLLVVSPDRKIIGRFIGFQTAAQLDGRLATYAKADSSASVPRDLLGRRPLVVPPERQRQNPFGGSRA